MSTVYVLNIEHRHGMNTTVHSTEAAARNELSTYVRQFWHEVADVSGCPGIAPGDDDAIAKYFEFSHDERYSISEADLDKD